MKRLKFISYVNGNDLSLTERIRCTAELTGRFDEIWVYNRNDLPTAIQDNESLGKPWAILNEMEYMEDDDIIVCSDLAHIQADDKDWKKWRKILQKKSALFFFSGPEMDTIGKMCMHDSYARSKMLTTSYRLDGNFFLLKKSSRHLIEEWCKTITKSKIGYINDENIISKANNVQKSFEESTLNAAILNHIDDPNIEIAYMNSSE